MIPKDVLKKIQKIHIRTNHIVNDIFAGEYESAFRGRGMEFEEVREYTPGDDVRDIDWNVTARFGHPFVKVYREERELTIMLLVDVSSSCLFGTQRQLKQELAAELASVLALRPRIIVLDESEGTLDTMLTAAAKNPAATRMPARGGGLSSLMRMLAAEGGEVDLSDLALKKISKKATNQAEREVISLVLIKTGWNRSKASRILNVSYKTLLQKIEELAIVPPPELA